MTDSLENSPSSADCVEPVLVLAFNRPDLLAVLLESLRQARPPRVYIAIDGPRPDHLEDAERVLKCRDLVSTIDWTADVSTLFQEENLGCGLGVSTAISWFFEHEERGIILEDDIVPGVDFFAFMHQALERYAEDPRVFAVSGSSYVPSAVIAGRGPFRFSRYPYVWGWATWRRSWDSYRFEVEDWRRDLPTIALWRRCGRSLRATVHWTRTFDDCGTHRVDTWDGQLVLAALRQGALTAVPNVNLTDNAGFGSDATHTTRLPSFLTPAQPLTGIVGPIDVTPDGRADRWVVKHQLGATLPRFVARELRRLRQRLA